MNQRERFEAALRADGFADYWFARDPDSPEQYYDDITECRWEGFQLGEASGMERAAAECERMELYAGGKQESPAHNDVWSAAKAIRALMAQGEI